MLSLGAGFASAQTGIILNNEMADFSSPSISFYGLPPSSTNTIQPGKRPLSSMTPVIVIDSSSGGVRLVVGAAGGIRITTSTVYVRLYYIPNVPYSKLKKNPIYRLKKQMLFFFLPSMDEMYKGHDS